MGLDVNLYLEDWSSGMRDSVDYVYQLLDALRHEPVHRYMLSDTLGIMNPLQCVEYMRKMVKRYPGYHFDFHGHNDYDLAVSNTLAAVLSGCKGLHVTVNGLGERCGNAPLASVQAILRDHFDAKTNMMKKASLVTEEDDSRLHVALVMNSWVVELHGSLFHKFFTRLNTTLADLQSRLHQQRRVRLWNNDGVDIALPDPDLDVIFVFSHILEHFFEKGVGLRQICDWCRLLYSYRDTFDTHLLEQRLRQMDIVSEWKAFAAFAVLYLDMPAGFMPLYSPASRWARKAHRILRYVLKYGNFGHNRDTTYIFNASFLKKKAISFRDMVGETVAQLRIFPKDTLTIIRHKMADSISRAMRGVR